MPDLLAGITGTDRAAGPKGDYPDWPTGDGDRDGPSTTESILKVFRAASKRGPDYFGDRSSPKGGGNKSSGVTFGQPQGLETNPDTAVGVVNAAIALWDFLFGDDDEDEDEGVKK